MDVVIFEVEQRTKHDGQMDDAYQAGYDDGQAGYVYRNTKIPCICKACQATYRVGFENGQLAAKAKDED